MTGKFYDILRWPVLRSWGFCGRPAGVETEGHVSLLGAGAVAPCRHCWCLVPAVFQGVWLEGCAGKLGFFRGSVCWWPSGMGWPGQR